jgi:serine protease AprX
MKRIYSAASPAGRVVLGLIFCSLGLILAMLAFSSSAANRPGDDKISSQVLADTEAGDASIVILLADQADVSAASNMTDQDARGWFVYNTLTQHAARTQAGLRAFLESRGASYQSFWAANMIVTRGDRSLVESLASRSDVARVDSNNAVRWIEDPEVANPILGPAAPDAETAVEWGVANVNAPAVWAQGYTGTGIVIGNLDTGTRWTHKALKPKYRGWYGAAADHSFNWHDAIHTGGGVCGENITEPCDDSGHGTHTAGSAVGDDGAGNQIGVAPGAKWIGCRNMDQGDGTPARYTECFQFMLAPTDLAGNNANPAFRPHIVNNSWGCPASEGCTTRTELETIINNVQAAGIFVVVAAGNSGPGCSTVSEAPGIYSASFSVGAIDINNLLAGFSSRGPSSYYSPALLKPELSAPGANVRSSTNSSDTTYVSLSGTSMASPHVSGVVALLWSARPQLLRNIAATKTLLENTANPLVTVSPVQTCGGISSSQIPNNSFGYGRIDALAAVNAAPAPPTLLANIGTRLHTEAGENALIGGFILTGSQDKRVLIRAIGPSLALPDKLLNPTLELHDSSGAVIAFNDNWISSPDKPAINGSGLAPTNDLESAIIATLPANGQTYTAIVRGVANATGSAVVEIYDVDRAANSKLANISTRGFVQTGDNVLFAGTIVSGQAAQKVIVRAIGPSLSVAAKMADPTLELRDSNGTLMQANDNWVDSPDKQAIIDSTVPPTDDHESAIVATLSANNASYTAIVRGANDTTGIAVVEVYALP